MNWAGNATRTLNGFAWSSGSPTLITCQVAGRYLLAACATLTIASGADNGVEAIYIEQNGVAKAAQSILLAAAGAMSVQLSTSVFLTLAVGDTISL